MHRQQRIPYRSAHLRQQRLGTVAGDLEEQLARQRISVSMQTRGRQPQQHVAGVNRAPGQQLRSLGGAYDEARQVVFGVGIQTRHLGSLASDQRATIMLAAARNPCDHRRGHRGMQLPYREVVHEKERHRALNRDIIDAMVYQVLPHRVVATR